MAIEGIHLVHIGFDAGHLYGMVGTDDNDAPFAFELLYPLELGIVALASGAQCLAQLGIAAIYKRWQVRRLLLLAVAEMPGEQTYLSYCAFFLLRTKVIQAERKQY